MHIISILFFALLVSLLWGSQPVIHKHLLSSIHPVTILLTQTMINYVCIATLASFNYERVYDDFVSKFTLQHWCWIFFLAVLTIFGTNIMYLYILKSNESSLVSALIYSAPIFTMILAYIVLNEKISLNGYIGILLIVTGVCFVAINVSDNEEFSLVSKID
jgi:drug/metabolite transporter (DMT)-like permease